MNILFIGNSYTYFSDMPKIFEALARENGKEASVDAVTKGGRMLHENLDPKDENHIRIANLLKEKSYDVLVLQEHSCLSITDYVSFERGACALADTVKAKRVVLYSTWGRKTLSPKLDELKLTSSEMTDLVYERYTALAEKMGADISPVGLVFREISDPDVYDPDLSHPSYFGSCVAALCHYSKIFGEIPKNIDSLGISASDAEIAINAVKKFV